MSSESSDTQIEPIHEFQIPSLLTNAASVVFENFSGSIIELEARASTDTENVEELLRDHGLLWRQLQRQTIELDYVEQRGVDGEPHNPLTTAAVDEIRQTLARRLGDPNTDVEPEMAVSKLVLRLDIPQLQAATRAQSAEFELTFIADPVLGEDAREATAEANLGTSLYSELGFEYRNLNLRRVVETRAKYAEQPGDGTLMGWGGPDDTRGRCPHEVARTIHRDVLPEKYARLKFFRVGAANRVELTGLETDTEAGG
jgi:hypothetical protein